jgi:hypothetical protein
MHLRSCTGCSRHVKATETVCPFCQSALVSQPERPVAKVNPGLSRAQRLALSAAALASQALTACPSDVVTPLYGAPVPSDAGTAGTSAGAPAAGSGGTRAVAGAVAMPLYGAPLAGAGPIYGAPVAGNPGSAAGFFAVPPYGAPVPVPDGGTDDPEDSGVDEPVDSGTKDAGVHHPMPVPLYGAPAPFPKN